MASFILINRTKSEDHDGNVNLTDEIRNRTTSNRVGVGIKCYGNRTHYQDFSA